MTNTLPQASDSRPRITYRLPDGTPVRIIHDHGQVPTETISFTLAGGEVVEAALVPRKVIVRYLRSDGGWTFEVLDAETRAHIGGGWSAGGKLDAIDSFKVSARELAWVLA